MHPPINYNFNLKSMQKIALLSDIHGNLPALQQVVADMERRGVERVFNLGDHVSGPLWPKETIQFLMGQDWAHILGNHDRQLVSQDAGQHGPSDRYAFQHLSETEHSWLRGLPASLELEHQLLLFHGSPSSDSTYLLETIEHGRLRLAAPAEIEERLGRTRLPVLLCGHTHTPRVVELADHTLIVNPGSVGLPAYYDDDFSKPHVMETGSPHARYAILENIERGWRVEMVALEYDHHQAADQARKNGRLDWEMGLRTGFMGNFRKTD
jgi:predicted phosphodiesterase